MFLKNYQIKVTGELKRFFQSARETRDAIETARKALPENLRHTLHLNWVQNTFENLHKPYNDRSINGFGNYYPRICLKVATGGGKTVILEKGQRLTTQDIEENLVILFVMNGIKRVKARAGMRFRAGRNTG